MIVRWFLSSIVFIVSLFDCDPGVQMPMPNFPASSTPSYPPGGQYPPTQPGYPGYPPAYPPQQPQPPYPGGFQQPYTAPYPGQVQPPYPVPTGESFCQVVNVTFLLYGAIHLWRPHGGGRGVRLKWTYVDGGRGVRPHVDVHTEN